MCWLIVWTVEVAIPFLIGYIYYAVACYWIYVVLITISVVIAWLIWKLFLLVIARYAIQSLLRLIALGIVFGLPVIYGGLGYAFKNTANGMMVNDFVGLKIGTILNWYESIENSTRYFLGLGTKDEIISSAESIINWKRNKNPYSINPKDPSQIALKDNQQTTSTSKSANKKANSKKQADKEAEAKAAKRAEENMRKFNEQLKAQQPKKQGNKNQQQNKQSKGKPINVTPKKE